MAKIALELEQALARRRENGEPGQISPRVLATGEGWTVTDVVCTSGPQDRPFEEQHSHYSIVMIAAGSFQYRGPQAGFRPELMTPGSLLLGNADQCFECGHEHGIGDRCISFSYERDYFEKLVADAGLRCRKPDFHVHRIPPLRPLSQVLARAHAALLAPADAPWEELAVQLAAQTIQLSSGLLSDSNDISPAAVARVTRVVRMIERHPDAELTLASLAQTAGLSPYHFLRTFERLTGLTPHQYILRTRLREAATRLALESTKILDIALDCGFGDVSNFNHAFRAEFGTSPRQYRSKAAHWL